MKRRAVYLDPVTDRTLLARAQAHGQSLSAAVRAAITGSRPGGAPGQAARTADEWWDSLPPSRRAQIHRWVAGGSADPTPDMPGQLTIFEGDPS